MVAAGIRTPRYILCKVRQKDKTEIDVEIPALESDFCAHW